MGRYRRISFYYPFYCDIRSQDPVCLRCRSWMDNAGQRRRSIIRTNLHINITFVNPIKTVYDLDTEGVSPNEDLDCGVWKNVDTALQNVRRYGNGRRVTTQWPLVYLSPYLLRIRLFLLFLVFSAFGFLYAINVSLLPAFRCARRDLNFRTHLIRRALQTMPD